MIIELIDTQTLIMFKLVWLDSAFILFMFFLILFVYRPAVLVDTL